MSSKKSSDEPTTSRGTENEKQSLEAENAKLKETIEKLKKKVKKFQKMARCDMCHTYTEDNRCESCSHYY